MSMTLQSSIVERSFDSPSSHENVQDTVNKSLVHPKMAMNLTKAEEASLQRAFDLFSEGRGYIVVGELRDILDELVEEEVTNDIKDGTIRSRNLKRLSDQLQSLEAYQHLSREEYLQLFLPDKNQNPMQHLFELFDIDKKGYIHVQDLQRVAEELGESDLSSDELQEMIDRYATDGRVNIEQFQSMLEQKLFQEI